MPDNPKDEYQEAEPDIIYISQRSETVDVQINKHAHFNPVVVKETEDVLILRFRARVPEMEVVVRAKG